MNKIMPIMVIITLIFSGAGVYAINTNVESEEKIFSNNIIREFSFEDKIVFSDFEIEKNDEYIEILSEKDTVSYITLPGKPMLPKIVKSVELPFNAKNIDIEVTAQGIDQNVIEKEIKPVSPMQPLTADVDGTVKLFKDTTVYSSSDIYPSDWYKHNIRSGLNAEGKVVKHVSIHVFPVRYLPNSNMVYKADEINIKINYDFDENIVNSVDEEYDMVIIAPSVFSKNLEKLVEHKNDLGVKTFLKTTEEIYEEYKNDGRDKPEQIKYFIKYAYDEYEIKYVLLVGGLKSRIWAKPRDDENQGSRDWYLPVRYTNLYDNPKHPLAEGKLHDPGVISDLYYADIYDGENNFSSWDPNEDDTFAAWGKPGVENDTGLDLMPELSVGRLPCRSNLEVRNVVNKIITYENNVYGTDWFKKTIVVSGDGFLDQEDLDFQWNTSGLENGEYTIYAKSYRVDKFGKMISGNSDIVTVTLDDTAETSISFNHDDHLQVNKYPALPIAEITSPSNGDVLGKDDYFYEPTEGEAYDNQFSGWANVSYTADVMHIRGKSYDPRPYGNLTNIHVWIVNEDDEKIFDDWRNNTEMYYEGEWVTGEKTLRGRGGALYYMPEDFEKDIIWTSNGRLTGQQDVINSFSKGAGFLFMSGHGSPNVWADHYPGVPGNRGHGSVDGLSVTTLKPWPPFFELPIFPMNKISNGNKQPVVVIGGCHNSQFNVSAIPAMMHILYKNLGRDSYMWTYGSPVFECFSWRLVSLPRDGAIASIGNTGLGYGRIGDECTSGGGDGWVSIEFFRQYGEHGHEILGDAFQQVLVNYVNSFDMSDLEAGHAKTIQQWVLFGDPSLKMGGYE